MSGQLLTANQSELPIWRFTFPSNPAAEELKFRQHYLDADIKQVRSMAIISIVLLVVMSLADIPQMDEVEGLGFGIALRAIMIFLCVLLIWATSLWRSPRTVDIGFAAFAFSIAFCIVYFHLTTDVSAPRVAAIGTLFIFVANITFPVYGLYLLPAISIFLVGESFVLFDPSRELMIQHRPIIVITFLFAELMSMFASAHLQRTRFMAYQALAEVKTLSGMIPICSNCKKIRDDSGYYQQLEQYISSHSGAQFSHGVCPDCVIELYPELNPQSRLFK